MVQKHLSVLLPSYVAAWLSADIAHRNGFIEWVDSMPALPSNNGMVFTKLPLGFDDEAKARQGRLMEYCTKCQTSFSALVMLYHWWSTLPTVTDPPENIIQAKEISTPIDKPSDKA